MNLQYRIDLLARLGNYILSEEEQWLQKKKKPVMKMAGSFPNLLTWLPIILPGLFCKKMFWKMVGRL